MSGEPEQMMDERAAGGVDAFGRWLQRERELRGLDREEVAHVTKLAPGVIEALESGDADRIPPRAYLFGYLRSYASAVGLDADDVVLRWREVEGAVGSPAPPKPARRRRIAAAVALLVGLAVGALVAISRCSA